MVPDELIKRTPEINVFLVGIVVATATVSLTIPAACRKVIISLLRDRGVRNLTGRKPKQSRNGLPAERNEQQSCPEDAAGPLTSASGS